MEIRTGKYTNFILTVIAVLLAVIVCQGTVELATQAHAQPNLRNTDTDTPRQAVLNSVPASDPALSEGLQMIAASIRDVAVAIDGLAATNTDVASAISAAAGTTE